MSCFGAPGRSVRLTFGDTFGHIAGNGRNRNRKVLGVTQDRSREGSWQFGDSDRRWRQGVELVVGKSRLGQPRPPHPPGSRAVAARQKGRCMLQPSAQTDASTPSGVASVDNSKVAARLVCKKLSELRRRQCQRQAYFATRVKCSA